MYKYLILFKIKTDQKLVVTCAPPLRNPLLMAVMTAEWSEKTSAGLGKFSGRAAFGEGC